MKLGSRLSTKRSSSNLVWLTSSQTNFPKEDSVTSPTCTTSGIPCIQNKYKQYLVLDHANNVRHSIASEKVRENTIIIADEWEAELKAMPFTSKEKGRMSHLLK